MTFSLRTLLLVVSVLVLLGSITFYYHGKYLDEQQRADTAEQSLGLANATINDMQVRQRDVTALDAKYTKELADANAQNAALQRRLDNGGRVLVKGKCPVPASNQSTSSGSVGNDASIELSDVAGRNVLSIRSGIISDQAKVKYLQDYIRQQCRRIN